LTKGVSSMMMEKSKDFHISIGKHEQMRVNR